MNDLRVISARATTVFGAVIALSAVPAVAGVQTINPVADFQKAVASANSLNVSFTVQSIGGTAQEYKLVAQKPNKFRVETPTEITVGDGNNVVTYRKSDGEYMRNVQTRDDAPRQLVNDPLRHWLSFFAPNLTPPISRSLGLRERNGVEYQAFGVAHPRGTATYYLAKTDRLLRQASLEEPGQPLEVMIVRDIALNGTIPADAFQFKAPANAKLVSRDIYNALKWMSDIEEAKRLSKRTGKKILLSVVQKRDEESDRIDREVFNTDRFKNYGKKLIFVRFDLRENARWTEAYGVEKVPTTLLLDKEGVELAGEEKYEDATKFYEWLDKALRDNLDK
ncbi:MAG: thioredoxin family protein [Fimbriimonadaceae bacterium]|nr:thioredoxin family protein [Fimbriimonadaceae bacterium]